MYKNILIATDGSELAYKAVNHGTELAKAVGASITFVSVTEIWPAFEMASRIEQGDQYAVEAFERKAEEGAKAILASASALADEQGVSSETIHIADAKPSRGILATADKFACDLIVMASHGHSGLTKMLLGSVATEVMTQSKVPVLICR